MMPFGLALAARAVAAFPVALEAPTARTLGCAWWALDAPRRRAVAANRGALRARFPGHRPFARYLLALFGWLRLLGLTRAQVRSRTRVEGAAPLHAARRAGRGAVLVAAHVGEWEWGAAALAARGLEVVAVAGIQMRPGWSFALARAKARLGIEVVGPDASPARLVRALRRGAVVALLVDGDVATARAAADLLGRTALLPLGPSRLAARTGALLVGGRCERDPARAGRYRVRLALLGDTPDPAAPLAETHAFALVTDWLARTLADNADRWCLFRPFFEPVS